MSEPLKALWEIFWKGAVPPLIAMVLVIAGLLIGNPMAWIPIGVTLAMVVTLFVYRIRQIEVQDMERMLKPFKIEPTGQLVEEYKKLLRPKRTTSDETGG